MVPPGRAECYLRDVAWSWKWAIIRFAVHNWTQMQHFRNSPGEGGLRTCSCRTLQQIGCQQITSRTATVISLHLPRIYAALFAPLAYRTEAWTGQSCVFRRVNQLNHFAGSDWQRCGRWAAHTAQLRTDISANSRMGRPIDSSSVTPSRPQRVTSGRMLIKYCLPQGKVRAIVLQTRHFNQDGRDFGRQNGSS